MRIERDQRTDRRFERALSAAGAVALLAIALLGPAGVAVAILAFVVVAIVGMPPRMRRRRSRPIHRIASDERWRVWRHEDPDPEFLRGGRRRRRAA
jgi:hypothetical protein